MPELVSQWDLSDDSRLYGKIGTSAKSGGFATSGSAPTRDSIEFDDETAITGEIGYRTRFMEGRGRFNVTAFYTQFEDVQVQTFQLDGANVLSLIDNAGESTSKGLEFEIDYLLANWLTIGASVGLLDAEWDKFPSAPCDFATKNSGNYDGEVPGTCNFNGKPTQFAPDYSGSLYADMNLPITSTLNLRGGINMGFSDDFFTESTLDPVAMQESYTRWDANIGIANVDGKWSLSLVGKNLSNEKILSNTVPVYPFSYVGYIHMPRTVTLQGRYNF